MPVRGIIFPTERCHFGFVDRLYVHIHLPPISELQNAGLTSFGIAAEMNKRGGKATNRDAWDTQHATCDVRDQA